MRTTKKAKARLKHFDDQDDGFSVAIVYDDERFALVYEFHRPTVRSEARRMKDDFVGITVLDALEVAGGKERTERWPIFEFPRRR